MPIKRRLEDLYIIGREVVIDDGAGSVTVWLQKLSPVELSSAMRQANAVRARILSVRSDQTSDEYMAMWLAVLEWNSAESLVEYLVIERVMRIKDRCEAQLAAEEEWSTDNYLQGLRDAWAGGLSETHMTEPEDPEASRVLAELTRFADQAESDAEPEIEALRADYASKAMEELQEEALDRTIAYRANSGWLDEFHRAELLYGVRDPHDHKARYFAKREELDHLSLEVMSTLLAEYASISVDVIEGKDSAATPTSSGSSEPRTEGEQLDSSGLVSASP